MTLESTVEAYLVRVVRSMGGLCHKLHPSTAGMPDRLVILPGGRIHLVELKTEKGRLRAVQRAWHRKARARGLTVPVLHTKDAVDAWAKTLRPTEGWAQDLRGRKPRVAPPVGEEPQDPPSQVLE